MRILNFGSLNLDYVYAVDHFVRPGETLAALSRTVKAGGKGLNQSVALSRAGAAVFHAGCLGSGGELLKTVLETNRVDTGFLLSVPEAQGHAVIQVNAAGENCILICGGSNRCVPEDHIRRVMDSFAPGDWLILQNEINGLPLIVELAAARGMHIALNPSPFDAAINDIDLSKVDWLLTNEIEAEQLSGNADPEAAWEKLHARYRGLSLLVTLGSQGSMAWHATGGTVAFHREKARSVKVVDTTAAGDTYTGYFIAGLMEGLQFPVCMQRAGLAAAIAVTRPGAAGSIPWKHEI